MKALAEFIMRGRSQAMLVAALGTFSLLFAWLGAAAVALVIMRLGMNAGVTVLLAAIVPGAFWTMLNGEIGPLSTVLCVAMIALVLRWTRDWSSVMVALPMVIGCWCMSLLLFAPELFAGWLAQLQQVTDQLFARMNEQREAAGQEVIADMPQQTVEQLLGVFALMQLLSSVLSLMVARWMQALLYNPGGFREEIHGLRLNKWHVVLLVLGLVLLSNNETYRIWSWLFALPICIAGLALVHGVFRLRNISGQWLLLFYIALFFLAPLTPLLMMLAIADSALDFRGRLRSAAP